ncbi:hypothetical protein [Candidiatus Paracoxiella cheracis]|uniref:hypothetical protein n=1 Tax=Candidiatus Paracoxiella cheracis TaxID=3405120 RepID=UPI003BF5F440
MKTKPPLTLKGLLKWTSDITRELYGCLKDGSLKYPQVKSKTDLLVLAQNQVHWQHCARDRRQ